MEPVKFRWRHQRQVGDNAPRLIVFLDGVQNTETRPGTYITDQLLGYGDIDFVAVDFPKPFDCEYIINSVCLLVKGYRRITFIVVSVSGLVAHDIVARIQQDSDVPCDIIMAQAPTGKQDLHNQHAVLAPYVPRVWLPASLNSKLMGGDDPNPPREELNPIAFAEWREHMARSHAFPFRELMRQVTYIVRHPGPRREVMQSVRAVFIESTNDKIVKDSAYTNWSAVGTVLRLMINTPNHADLLEYPSQWAAVLLEALRLVDQRL